MPHEHVSIMKQRPGPTTPSSSTAFMLHMNAGWAGGIEWGHSYAGHGRGAFINTHAMRHNEGATLDGR